MTRPTPPPPAATPIDASPPGLAGARLDPGLERRLDAYAPVAQAIDFLVAARDEQPSLDAVAAHVGLSPSHFQRVFKAGAGVSPKRFLQYLAAGDARRALHHGEPVLDAALSAGLSGPSRLHDLFLCAEAMSPGAYRRKGEGETIRYGVFPGPFGDALIGATDKGICWLSFIVPAAGAKAADAEAEMRADWPAATFHDDAAFVAPLAAKAFAFTLGEPLDGPLGLHVQGTNFQLKVWEALLRIPMGAYVTYGDVAASLGTPRASRAVGSAVGANMISVLIPCHRVIRASGAIYHYRWGAARKQAILAFEAASAA